MAGAVVTGLLAAFPHLLNRTDEGLRRDAREAAGHLPRTTGTILDSLAMTLLVLLVASLVAERVLRRRARAGVTAAVAVLAAAVVVGALGLAFPDLAPRWVGSEGWSRVLAAGAAASGAAIATAVVVAGTRWARRGAWIAAAGFVVAGAWTDESIGGRLWLLALGTTVGGTVLLVAGTPSGQATAADVVAGLEAIGMVPQRVEPHAGDARGSLPWFVELRSGTRLFVKTASSEERIADLLYRLWRRIQLKDSGDTRPAASLQQAAEHESLAATRAIAAGVRTPRVLGLGRLPDGGVFSLHEVIEGRDLVGIAEDDGPDAIGEATLREVWSMVTTLHRGRIAHRDLRAANVVVADDGEVWLVDFAFADVAADDELRQRDLVELLASTAGLVGVDRAVDAAVTTLGEETWHDILPFVQPLATTAATRASLGRDGFAELRAALVSRIQASEPELPRLGRLDGRTILSVLALGVATWTLLPQLTQSDEVWDQLPDADLGLLGAAALASITTYVGAALSLRGAVPRPLPLVRTVLSQLASSFANRVTPAKVGGLAVNVRWMVKEGVETPVAAAGVSVNALAGLVLHVVLTVFVVLWAGQAGLGDIDLPSARTIGVALAIVAGALVLTYLIPPLRRTIRHRMWPRTRQSLQSVGEVAADRRRLVSLFGGSLLVTASYVAALAFSLAAVDARVPVATVALVYLAGSALASAAPTPGGLGATEATFAAALTAVGVGDADAVSGVLLYRLVTFWLPILPGYLSYLTLQRAGRL
ncbi:MAG TPA: lysylphosphatidylglycerol synthase transmembrane domain-containing protein [Acidimicrobiales bacterium]|nr:lysylphosphatidylglycerol synthase transmembrane domain-containing protein [Acidimicrobiales bacterium]